MQYLGPRLTTTLSFYSNLITPTGTGGIHIQCSKIVVHVYTYMAARLLICVAAKNGTYTITVSDIMLYLITKMYSSSGMMYFHMLHMTEHKTCLTLKQHA